MISGVRGRQSFQDLYRHGRRARVSGLQVTYRANVTPLPRLAFAINRKIGTAVVRNRARRRLRSAFLHVVRNKPQLVPPGDYLISVYDGIFDYSRGEEWLISALERLQVR